jgi:hypothetical protein
VTYTLCAVVVYMASPAPHYKVHCKNTTEWYPFDDGDTTEKPGGIALINQEDKLFDKVSSLVYVKDAVKPMTAPIEPTPIELMTAPIEPTMATIEPLRATIEPTTATIEATMATIEPMMATIEPTMAPINPTMALIKPTTAFMEPTMASIEPMMALEIINGAYILFSIQQNNILRSHQILFTATEEEHLCNVGDNEFVSNIKNEDTPSSLLPGTVTSAAATADTIDNGMALIKPTTAFMEPTTASIEPTTALEIINGAFICFPYSKTTFSDLTKFYLPQQRRSIFAM